MEVTNEVLRVLLVSISASGEPYAHHKSNNGFDIIIIFN